MTTEHPAHSHADHVCGDAHPAPSAAPLKDPVCGMTVTPASKHQHVHAGQTWYFCNPRCREKFIANPAQYLPGAPKPGATVSSGPTVSRS